MSTETVNSEQPTPNAETGMPDIAAFKAQRAAAEAAIERALAGRASAGPAALPAGCWQIAAKHPGHRGVKSMVLTAVKCDETIPAHWRAAILAEIELMEAQAVEVHGHGQAHPGGGVVMSFNLRKMF